MPDSAAIVVACSGGADSAAALALLRGALPDAKLIACYVDHGIRPRARILRDVDAVRVQARAARAEVEIAAVEPPQSGESKEAGARRRRYAALARVARSGGASFVVTAHHADDVAESLVLSLMRGSGLDGAARMPVRRPIDDRIALARPFLWARKSELEAHARSLGLSISRDETNADSRIRRNAVRRMLERLEIAAPGSLRAIARSAALLAADKRLLAGITKIAWQRCRVGEVLSTKSLRGLPPQLLRRVVRFAVARSHGGFSTDFHRTHCDAIVRAIKDGRGGAFHAGKAAAVIVSAGKMKVTRTSPNVAAQESPSESDLEADVRVPAVGKVTDSRLSAGSLELRWDRSRKPAPRTMYLDGRRLPPGSKLTLRLPKRGDVCVPSGRHRPVPLARFLAKSGVPKDERAGIALLCRGGQIAAALGIRVMEPYAAKNERRIAVRWRPAADIRR